MRHIIGLCALGAMLVASPSIAIEKKATMSAKATVCTGTWAKRGSAPAASFSWDGSKVVRYDYGGSVPISSSSGMTFTTSKGQVTLQGTPEPGKTIMASYGGEGGRAAGTFTCS